MSRPSGKPYQIESAHYFDLHENSMHVVINGSHQYRIPAHAHPHFELLYVLRGTRMIRMHNRTFRARGGDLIVFRPDEEHEEWAGSKSISYFFIRFYPDDLSAMQLEFPATEEVGPVIRLPNRERFQEVLGRMLEERKHPRDGTDLLLGAYLVEFVVLLDRALRDVVSERETPEDAPRARVRLAMEHMRENLSRHLDLSDLARNAFMSVSHFSHVFKETTGDSPKSYLIKERIEKAKQLLCETDKPAQEIAQLLGYDSPYFFYRQFKQKTGLTTAEFRKRSQ